MIMWSRQELKADSRNLLSLNYWPFVLVAFIYGLVAGGGGYMGGGGTWRYAEHAMDDGGYSHMPNAHHDRFLMGFLGLALIAVLIGAVGALALSIFVFHPIQVGCIRYMTMAREVKPQFGEMVFAFKNCYGNIVKTMFLKNLYTALWSLLFVIPGIVKAYEYAMVPFLIAEYPDMESSEAFRISREMMMGDKWNAFVLDLSFLGWNFLGAITLGIVNLFYARPYQLLTMAGLYLRLKGKSAAFAYVPNGGSGNYKENPF